MELMKVLQGIFFFRNTASLF